VLAVVLAVVMFVCGTSAYLYLGSKQSKAAVPAQKPTAATPRAQALSLPGTIYLAQSGALYSLSAGRFHQLTPEAGWAQPSLYPDGSAIIAVKYGAYWSDVYVLNRYGTAVRQVTTNQARSGIANPSLDHSSFIPRLTPDGTTPCMT